MSEQEKPVDLIESIVDLLKEHMGVNFTLFQFSETSDRELLELLNSIIHQISDDQPEKLGTEKIEATVDRISEFLRVMKYNFPVVPEEWDVRLGNADKDLIYPVLHWLLSDFENMKKRAYKARYNEEVPIPDEIKVDDSVSELIGQHRELREMFDQLYDELEEIGSNNADSLKKTKSDLEADKARLATKIAAFKRKLSKVQNVEELLKWTSKLRVESEREMKLNDELQRLTEDKAALMKRGQAADDQIKNMKTTMQNKLKSLQNEYNSLRNTSPGASLPDDKGLIAKQQVIAASKRLDAKRKQLADLQAQLAEAENTLKERQGQEQIVLPSPQEFVNYVRDLKTKNENYKELQAQLANRKREIAIMMRTEEIVNQQKEKVQREVLRIERERGVGGFREAREQLEKVSATKADLDDMKGQTLEEMSSISKEIQRSIQARQAELKPLVAKLQEQRKKKATVESKYLQVKQRYQNAVSEYDSVCMELEEESKKIRADIAASQSKYHYTTQLQGILDRQFRRAREEQNANETGNPVSKTIKTYADYFQKAANQMKKETRELKEQKKNIGNQTEANQKQLEMFQSLRRLLQVKLECQKKATKQKEEKLKQDDFERMNPDEIITIE